MKQLNEWANKNPKLAGGGAIGILILVVLIIYFTQFAGSPGGGSGPAAPTTTPTTTPGAPGTAAAPAPGAPPGAAMPGMAPPGAPGAPGGAGAAAGATGSSDPDSLPKWTAMAANSGRPNPMQPLWAFPIPPPPPRITYNPIGDPRVVVQGFTPPTPGTPLLASRFWDYYHSTDPVPPLVTPSVPGGGGESISEANPNDRMAGVMYGGGKVMAVVERSTGDQSAASYVVQPGDPIGNDTVVAISPTSVTLRHEDGTSEQIDMRAGSMKGLAPANAQSQNPPGFGAGMPGGPMMGGPMGGGPMMGGPMGGGPMMGGRFGTPPI